MRKRALFRLSQYVRDGALPLFVKRIPKGTHSQRNFHDHEYTELVIIAEGSAVHLLDGQSHRVKRGDVLLVHPGVLHSYDETADMELVNVAYDCGRLGLPRLDGSSLPLFSTMFPQRKEDGVSRSTVVPVTSLEPVALANVLNLSDRLCDETNGVLPGNLFLSLALFMEIITQIGRAGRPGQPADRVSILVGDAVGYINRNYASPVTVDELAHVAKMSARNFFRHFRNTIGCTPIEYLLQVRITRAAELLFLTDAGVEEIALQCGFCDGNYFCRKFREAKGTTPRNFRLQAR